MPREYEPDTCPNRKVGGNPEGFAGHRPALSLPGPRVLAAGADAGHAGIGGHRRPAHVRPRLAGAARVPGVRGAERHSDRRLGHWTFSMKTKFKTIIIQIEGGCAEVVRQAKGT